MKKIIYYLRENLEITTSEAKSVLAFLTSAIVATGIYMVVSFYTRSEYTGFTITKYTAELPEMPPVTVPEKTRFDPNTATEEQLVQLGIPLRVAAHIVNYRNKGGRFRYREDLQKIYSMKPELYSDLSPWIALPAKPSRPGTPTRPAVSKPVPQEITFDINTADTTQFKQLRGIGSTFALRIVRFRDALGGFHSLDQLDETYGIPPEVLLSLKKAGKLESPVKTIPINTTETFRHPYIKPYQVKALIAYRKQHGTFHSLADLHQIKVLDEETIQKMAPYLSF